MADFWNMISGYIIQPARRHPLIIVAWGVGSNGKSSLKDTLIRLLGANLVYAGQAHKLSEGRFTYGDLFGKLLFVDDDVPAGVRLPDGELKTISEDGGFEIKNLMRGNDSLPKPKLRVVIDRDLFHSAPGRIAARELIEFS